VFEDPGMRTVRAARSLAAGECWGAPEHRLRANQVVPPIDFLARVGEVLRGHPNLSLGAELRAPRLKTPYLPSFPATAAAVSG
jgi:hypothetical protein